MDSKTCFTCRQRLPVEDFYVRQGTCKQCKAAYIRTWKLRNPKLTAMTQLRSKYGLTREDAEAAYTTTRNPASRCDGCGGLLIIPGRKFKAGHVDHDHVTARVRGFLCHHCNITLGHVKDNPTTLRRLAEYLERQEAAG